MTFLGLTPAAAWVLLAGVAGLVLLLYLIKPSPRRITVASSLIWQRVLEQRQRKPERWRWWASLLLALAIGLAIAFALTRPELAALAGGAEDVLIVVDTSPSMGARSADGSTRLERAVIEVERIAAAAGGGSRFMLADTTHQIPTPVFVPREAVGGGARGLVPAVAERAWFPDLAGLPGLRAQRQIWFITDGVIPIQAPAEVRTVSVFRNADNVGITAFDVRAAPGDPRRHDAFVQIGNASAGNKTVQLRVAGVGGEPIDRSLRVDAGASANVVVDISGLGEGPVRVSVASEADGLALDDVAFGFLPAKARVRVALVTPGNSTLVRALRMLPRVDVQLLPPARSAGLAGFDAVIFDRVTPDAPPTLPTLLIAPRATAWLGRDGGVLAETSIAAWDDAHPLLARAGLRDVLIERVQPLRTAEQGGIRFSVIARGPKDEPLMLATREGPRVAVVAFALEASNFAQQPSFPAFLANAVNWLTHEAGAVAHRLGQVSVPAEARVLDLDGAEVLTRAVPGGAVFEARRPGLYTAITSMEQLRIAANLLDPQITAINASALGATQPSDVPAPVSSVARVDPWIVLMAAAALLLALEWWTYNRRVTL